MLTDAATTTMRVCVCCAVWRFNLIRASASGRPNLRYELNLSKSITRRIQADGPPIENSFNSPIVRTERENE